MAHIERKILIYALKAILAPVVRFCLRHSLKFQDFLDCAKLTFVTIAKDELETASQNVTSSRLSIMTGMHRRDINKYSEERLEEQSGKGLISKVIGQWQTDQRFTTTRGLPRVLTLGTDSEFIKLVSSVSKDLNPATVLFELERLGSVTRTEKGLRLNVETYVPKGDVFEGLGMLGRDSQDLVSAVEYNVLHQPKLPHLHLRTEYDKVREDALDTLKTWLLKEGHAFQIKARDFISQFDQDINPKAGYRGRFMRVVLGTFSNIK